MTARKYRVFDTPEPENIDTDPVGTKALEALMNEQGRLGWEFKGTVHMSLGDGHFTVRIVFEKQP